MVFKQLLIETGSSRSLDTLQALDHGNRNILHSCREKGKAEYSSGKGKIGDSAIAGKTGVQNFVTECLDCLFCETLSDIHSSSLSEAAEKAESAQVISGVISVNGVCARCKITENIFVAPDCGSKTGESYRASIFGNMDVTAENRDWPAFETIENNGDDEAFPPEGKSLDSCYPLKLLVEYLIP